MHFGQSHKRLIPIKFFILMSLCSILIACEDKNTSFLTFSSPIQGQSFNVGDTINVKLDFDDNTKIDSVSYLIDGNLVIHKENADSIEIMTNDLALGYRLVSAIIAHGDKKDTISTNIVLKTSQQPIQLNYKVVNTFPHNTNAYTEGLSYIVGNMPGDVGKLLESTGEKGNSVLKYVDLKTGKDLQQVKLDAKYFGEGCLKIGDKIIMLTYQENIGFVFDAKTLKKLDTFPYQTSKEGWGLAFDGKNILRTDGTNRIWRMNPSTYREEGYLEVYDHKGAVESLNELEYINGKIYANVYLSSKIIRINPVSGLVEAEIDLSALVPKNYFKTPEEIQNNVLNGIAWDAKGKRLFITGKKWPKLFEIKLPTL